MWGRMTKVPRPQDMSCRYPGCTDPDAENFSAAANEDDGSCVIHRCADRGSLRSRAAQDDGACLAFGRIWSRNIYVD